MTTGIPVTRYEEHILHLNDQRIAPGEQAVIRIQIGSLPSDTPIDIHLMVFRSQNPGPTFVILSGVHGDEINGIEVVRQTIEAGLYGNLSKGTVIAIPLLNVFGFINFSREVPDGKDVNRSFPGNMRGSLASRVASVITKRVLPIADYVIDLHTGGASRYNFPQVRFTRHDQASFALAKLFNAPFIIGKPPIKKSLRKVTKGLDIPTIVYEGGEALRLDGFAISKGIYGIRRVLYEKGCLNERPKYAQSHQVTHITKSKWIRASDSGIFTWSKASGNYVEKGEPLGQITDPYGQKCIPVLADRNGYIIGHNNAPVVNSGDALFHLGYEYEPV